MDQQEAEDQLLCVVYQKSIHILYGNLWGGLWKTVDGGLSWNNISDGYFESPSIGSIDVFQSNPDIIYVGTGSDGIHSNVIVGKGVYKSLDAGGSWEFIETKECRPNRCN